MPTSKKNVYTIVLHNTKKVLGVAEPSAENGCPVLLQDADNSVSQQWELISSETGCKLAHKASGRLLDVMQAGTENGSRLQLWEDVNGDSQLWQTEETDAGCKLKTSFGTLCRFLCASLRRRKQTNRKRPKTANLRQRRNPKKRRQKKLPEKPEPAVLGKQNKLLFATFPCFWG